LEWSQDTHWEVAEGIAKYLVPHVNEIAQELLFVLNTDDDGYILLRSFSDKDDSKGGYPVYDTMSKETVWTEHIEWGYALGIKGAE